MALDGVERPGQHDPQLQRHICTTGRWFHDTLGTPTRGTLFRCCSMSSILISRHLWRCAMFDLGVLALQDRTRSEEHTSELQSRLHLVCRLLLEKKKITERRYI